MANCCQPCAERPAPIYNCKPAQLFQLNQMVVVDVRKSHQIQSINKSLKQFAWHSEETLASDKCGLEKQWQIGTTILAISNALEMMLNHQFSFDHRRIVSSKRVRWNGAEPEPIWAQSTQLSLLQHSELQYNFREIRHIQKPLYTVVEVVSTNPTSFKAHTRNQMSRWFYVQAKMHITRCNLSEVQKRAFAIKLYQRELLVFRCCSKSLLQPNDFSPLHLVILLHWYGPDSGRYRIE